MKIHHLSCGSFCLPKIPFVHTPQEYCCHCLLIETNEGLVLVDSGFSTLDLQDPLHRLGPSAYLLGTTIDPEVTAIAQIQKMGFKASDVRHIVVTHLDPDHVGGIQDFPEAKVHLYKQEYELAMQLIEQKKINGQRFRAIQWKDWKNWEFYDIAGESWEGFQAVRPLRGLPEGIALVPLIGHTGGHCGVAVDLPDKKLLHAGDCFYQEEEITAGVVANKVIEGFAKFLAYDNQQRMLQLKRLMKLKKENPRVRVFCSHDLNQLNQLKNNG